MKKLKLIHIALSAILSIGLALIVTSPPLGEVFYFTCDYPIQSVVQSCLDEQRLYMIELAVGIGVVSFFVFFSLIIWWKYRQEKNTSSDINSE